jgi:hypothetical protein
MRSINTHGSVAGWSVIPAFTSTSASWMNMVEHFFRDLSQQAILPGSFGSVAELVDTINLSGWHLGPEAFRCH